MDLMIYSHPDHPRKQDLSQKIAGAVSPAPVMVFDLDGLFRQLRSRVSGRVIVIFLIRSGEELDRLMADRSRLLNTRYIIVLPDHNDDLASRGLALQPRYLGYDTPDFSDVCEVLKKMIKTYGRQL
jgi:hypothetical protein